MASVLSEQSHKVRDLSLPCELRLQILEYVVSTQFLLRLKGNIDYYLMDPKAVMDSISSHYGLAKQELLPLVELTRKLVSGKAVCSALGSSTVAFMGTCKIVRAEVLAVIKRTCIFAVNLSCISTVLCANLTGQLRFMSIDIKEPGFPHCNLDIASFPSLRELTVNISFTKSKFASYLLECAKFWCRSHADDNTSSKKSAQHCQYFWSFLLQPSWTMAEKCAVEKTGFEDCDSVQTLTSMLPPQYGHMRVIFDIARPARAIASNSRKSTGLGCDRILCRTMKCLLRSMIIIECHGDLGLQDTLTGTTRIFTVLNKYHTRHTSGEAGEDDDLRIGNISCNKVFMPICQTTWWSDIGHQKTHFEARKCFRDEHWNNWPVSRRLRRVTHTWQFPFY